MEKYAAAVWKDGWLSHSETFVRDQINALPDWNFLKLGFHRTHDPLIEPDYTPYQNDFLGRALRKVFGVTPFEKQYLQKINERDVTLIHAHFLSGGMNTAALARSAEIPLYTTLHNPRISFERSGHPAYLRGVYAHRLQQLVTTATKFLAVSNYVANEALLAGLPANKIEVLHIGTPIVPLVRNNEREGIIFVGRLIEIKGVQDLLEAVYRLPAPYKDTPITIVGDGPQREILEKSAADMNIRANFLGWKSSTELPSLLSQHEIFCGPSKTHQSGSREGFGMVFLEAALQELACVAYRSGGVTDAVSPGETGLLVEEGNIEQLSNALRSLLQDGNACRRMGEAGRMRVKNKFDLHAQSNELQKIFLSN